MSESERRLVASFLGLAAWGIRKRPEMAVKILRRVRDAIDAVLAPAVS